jgi:hypothetical protein
MALDIAGGVYKGRLVLGSEQFGESTNGNPELILDANLKIGDNVRRVSTPLYFSAEAAPYSFDRLRAAGWKGQGAADLADLTGIDTNELDFEVRHEEYNGEMKTKVQIMSGGGRFQSAKPVERASFAAKVAAITGSKQPNAAPQAPKPGF